MFFCGKALGKFVIARQVQINGGVGAYRILFFAANSRACLQQFCRQVMALGQQEPADLLDVGAGRDVHQVFFVSSKRKCLAEIVEAGVDLSEIRGL